MPNLKYFINKHNKNALHSSPNLAQQTCNCLNKVSYLLNKKCFTDNIARSDDIYKLDYEMLNITVP